MNTTHWMKAVLAVVVFAALVLGAAYRAELAAWFGKEAAQAQSGEHAGHEMKQDRKSTRLNSSHIQKSRMPSSA